MARVHGSPKMTAMLFCQRGPWKLVLGMHYQCSRTVNTCIIFGDPWTRAIEIGRRCCPKRTKSDTRVYGPWTRVNLRHRTAWKRGVKPPSCIWMGFRYSQSKGRPTVLVGYRYFSTFNISFFIKSTQQTCMPQEINKIRLAPLKQ